MQLSQLIYLSEARYSMTTEMLEKITSQASQRNSAVEITGILFYANRHFLQVLEGPITPVTGLFESIRLDPRHRKVQLLGCYPIRERRFASWDMHLLNLEETSAIQRHALDRLVQKHENLRLEQIRDYRELVQQLIDEFLSQVFTASAEQGETELATLTNTAIPVSSMP